MPDELSTVRTSLRTLQGELVRLRDEISAVERTLEAVGGKSRGAILSPALRINQEDDKTIDLILGHFVFRNPEIQRREQLSPHYVMWEGKKVKGAREEDVVMAVARILYTRRHPMTVSQLLPLLDEQGLHVGGSNRTWTLRTALTGRPAFKDSFRTLPGHDGIWLARMPLPECGYDPIKPPPPKGRGRAKKQNGSP